MSVWPIRTVRPNERGIVERMGKYHSFHKDGMVILIPFIDNLILVNTTEQMITAEKQEVITSDSLNAIVDAQIYFQIKSDEESVKRSMYSVFDYKVQIVSLSRTTLRSIIGSMSLDTANSQRNSINKKLMEELESQTSKWGIEVVRAELKEITPPREVQDSMNKVIIANKEKMAALDFATATETKADGQKRAEIKEAEGLKQANILKSEGEALYITNIAKAEAEKIRLVNEAAQTYFKGQAVEYRKLDTAQVVLASNTKVIVPEGSSLINVLSDSVGMTPIVIEKKTDDKKRA